MDRPRIGIATLFLLAALTSPPAAYARAFNNVGEFTQACSKMANSANTADLTFAQLAEIGQLRGYVDATIDSIETLYHDICLPAVSLNQVCSAAINWYRANPAAGQTPAYTGLIYALKYYYPCTQPSAPVAP